MLGKITYFGYEGSDKIVLSNYGISFKTNNGIKLLAETFKFPDMDKWKLKEIIIWGSEDLKENLKIKVPNIRLKKVVLFDDERDGSIYFDTTEEIDDYVKDTIDKYLTERYSFVKKNFNLYLEDLKKNFDSYMETLEKEKEAFLSGDWKDIDIWSPS